LHRALSTANTKVEYHDAIVKTVSAHNNISLCNFNAVFKQSLNNTFVCLTRNVYGPCSSVSIVTELRAGRSGDRISVGRDIPPVHTGPGPYPASCTMGTGSFQGVKSGRGVLLTTHPLLVPRSWKSRVIPVPTLWATSGPVTGTLYVTFNKNAVCDNYS